MCGSIEQQHHLWQPGLAFYGSGLACLPSLLWMVNADWLCSMRPKIFLQMKFIIFQGCSAKLPFYLKIAFLLIWQPSPYNQLLIQSLYRSWDYPEHFEIYSQLHRKSKTCFFIFLSVYLSWIEWDKNLISQLLPPKFRYFAYQNGPKGDPRKWILTNFKCKKIGFLTVTARKADEKNGVMNLVFILPSRFMVLKLSKIVSFLQFFADISKTSKVVIAIFVYTSECSRFALLENGAGYYGMI